LLLAQAAQSLADQGLPISLNAEMPAFTPTGDEEGIEQLSRIVGAEPEFVDAFLTLPGKDLDPDVYGLLAATLSRALDHKPQDAKLHCAHGRVLDRLGKADEAIAATRQALSLEPRSVQALIQLARLYQQTDRHEDARVRLEQALALGGEYADVYYMLGNLYRHSGQIERARWAYGQALKINDHYEAARTALDSLAA
jgi:tetratricopeptide (TPR) repeat protein